MKILYLSCHSILEYDELRIFRELGYSFFSLGAYNDPAFPHDKSRPPLLNCSVLKKSWLAYDQACNAPFPPTATEICRNKMLSGAFLDYFDVIIVMHIPDWIEHNWTILKGRNVIWRTIGQSTPAVETRLRRFREEGLKIVRYSPTERHIKEYIGEDVLIRFGKYPEDFKPWEGNRNSVMTIGQCMKLRNAFCNYDLFRKATADVPVRLYGHGNEKEEASIRGGTLQTYEDLVDTLSHYRVYFYTGTKPASYTLNFIEAAMAGIPIVSIGNASAMFEGHDYLEVPALLKKYKAGVASDDIDILKASISLYLENKTLADYASKNCLTMALELFDAHQISSQWKAFLESL